jgi:2-keto-3-deoxy-L-fuconate dehydrogenase
MSEFNGIAALVTGGASGIGAATASLLHERGARVAILDRDTDGAPAHALAVPCDVTDPGAVDEAVASVAGHFGALDVVINNAGIGATGSSTSTSSASPA